MPGDQIYLKQLLCISHKTRLLEFNLLPLIYIFDIQDILFVVKSLTSPTRNFNIINHIKFSEGHTRSSAHDKLKHYLHTSSSNRISYFHCLPGLWNVLPVIDINLSIVTIKAKLKNYIWNHFVDHFDDDNHCTYHYLCPSSRCHEHPLSSNFHSTYCTICVLNCKYRLLVDHWLFAIK